MHEMSLAEGILQIVEDAAGKQGFQTGDGGAPGDRALAGVEPDALTFCLDVVFKAASRKAPACELESLPGQGFCLACAETVPGGGALRCLSEMRQLSGAGHRGHGNAGQGPVGGVILVGASLLAIELQVFQEQ